MSAWEGSAWQQEREDAQKERERVYAAAARRQAAGGREPLRLGYTSPGSELERKLDLIIDRILRSPEPMRHAQPDSCDMCE